MKKPSLPAERGPARGWSYRFAPILSRRIDGRRRSSGRFRSSRAASGNCPPATVSRLRFLLVPDQVVEPFSRNAHSFLCGPMVGHLEVGHLKNMCCTGNWCASTSQIPSSDKRDLTSPCVTWRGLRLRPAASLLRRFCAVSSFQSTTIGNLAISDDPETRRGRSAALLAMQNHL